MRRARSLLLPLVVLLLAVPVGYAAADDHGDDHAPGALRAVGVTSNHVTLKAVVVPGIRGATATFEYGPTADYGSTVTALPATLPRTGATVIAAIDGLQPATTYHFRLVLTAAGVSTPGLDATFTTAAAPPADPSDDGGDHGKPTDEKTSDDSSSDDEDLAPVDAPAPPVLGHTLAVRPVAGKLKVHKPHGRGFVTLAAGANVPTGSVVDASEGTVAITSALDGGATQTGLFHGGRFVVRQSETGMIDLYLRGSLGRCHAGAASISRKRRGSLWGRDHGGRFRTHGASSVATVRGTRWLTQDTCAGTLTRVSQGVVSVRDLHRHRTVTVRAGHAYLARR